MKGARSVTVWLLPVLTGLLFIGVWYSLREIFKVSEWLLPMPHEIIATMGKESTVAPGLCEVRSVGIGTCWATPR